MSEGGSKLGSALVIARSQNKQSLKDAFRRLKRIRATCGDEELEQEELAAKDPLLAAMRNFETRISDAEELLSLPIDQIFSDQDKLHLRGAILRAQQELRTMEDMLATAEAKYNTAELKQKKPEKIMPLEAERDRIKQVFDQAQECMNDLKKTQAQREADQQAMIEKEGRSIFGRKKKDDELSMNREPITAADGGKAQKKTMSKAMEILARSQGIAEEDDLNNNQGLDTSAYQWDPSVSLATDKETKQQYAQISKQKREVNASLHRIQEGVERLHQMSKVMATEIENQSHRIESLETRVEERQQKLQDLNLRVEKLNDSIKPVNVCWKILCFLVLLGAVGFLLYYYGVVEV